MFDRMRLVPAVAISLLSLSLTAPAFAQVRPTINLNCSRGDSLANAAVNAFPNTLINIKGACAGPVSILASGIQLNAVGSASINGGAKTASPSPGPSM
jgi:hypothetical protein